MDFTGVIIEESLTDASILKDMRIVSTRVEPVTEKHKTPWLTQWTLHIVSIPADKIDDIAERLSHLFDRSGSWYADFKNDTVHYIVFQGKVFRVDRSSKEQYDEATQYGIALGIPAHQVDFPPHIQLWDR